MNNQLTIEDFRKILEGEYIAKGVKPPTVSGVKEQELFQQWLKGKEKLQKLTNNG